NIDELLAEFYDKMFLEASPEMKEYYDLLEKAWNTNKEGFTRDVHRDPIQQALVMTYEDVDKGLSILEAAFAKSDNPNVKARVEIIQEALVFYSYYTKGYAIAKKSGALKLN